MMGSEASERALHDRATRGEELTPVEQARLAAWYAQQDQAEEALLASPPSTSDPASLPSLRHEVDAALAQLRTVTQRIQTLTEQNETLHDEVAALGRRLAQTVSHQAA